MIYDKQELNGSYEAMLPLLDRLFQTEFVSSTDAIEFCREACGEYGFTIIQDTSVKRDIHIYCSRRGKPCYHYNQSFDEDQCDCKWHVVLTEIKPYEWKFIRSPDPGALEHNHEMSSPEELNWPAEIKQRIIQLARQKVHTDEIRETIKLQFPDIIWNDSRFYNYMIEERTRVRQSSIVDKVQRLILISTRLCSVVAANEDWSNGVESDLLKMLDNFKQITRISAQTLNRMVDLQLDMVHSDTDKNRRPAKHGSVDSQTGQSKKRKAGAVTFSPSLSNRPETLMEVDQGKPNESTTESNQEKGFLAVSIPSCTLYVRSQPLRSLSEPASHNKRSYIDYPPPSNPHLAPLYNASIQSTTPRIDISSNNYPYRFTNDTLQSSSLPESHVMYSNEQDQNSSSNQSYNQLIYPLQTPYPSYPSSTNYQTQNDPADIDFSFDSSVHPSSFPHINPLSLSLLMNRQQSLSSTMNQDRISYHSPVDYYSQQRILHQVYEPQNRQLISNQAETGNTMNTNEQISSSIQLPLIRTMNHRDHNQGVVLQSHPSHNTDPTWSSGYENNER
ncbi:hypothetical protein BDB01DRAFT_847970 [Pilobolus umbonatus]|nr:hypothetical protein BDB01DRAFT_847970 [Pilobolus umbonatus]